MNSDPGHFQSPSSEHVLSLYVFSCLQQISTLSRMYLSSHPITAGIQPLFDPAVDKWKKMDGWINGCINSWLAGFSCFCTISLRFNPSPLLSVAKNPCRFCT